MGRVWVPALLLCSIGCESRLILVDPPPGSCSPTSCTGCCDSHNTCLAGASQSETACGLAGSVCVQCAGGTKCINGECKRPPECGVCTGCCFGSLCLTGNATNACGKNGDVCASCGNLQQCVDAVCITCGPANCAGCCDSLGECKTGTTSFDCGRGGASCDFCGARACVAGSCQ